MPGLQVLRSPADFGGTPGDLPGIVGGIDRPIELLVISTVESRVPTQRKWQKNERYAWCRDRIVNTDKLTADGHGPVSHRHTDRVTVV